MPALACLCGKRVQEYPRYPLTARSAFSSDVTDDGRRTRPSGKRNGRLVHGLGRLRPCAQDGRERCDFAVGQMVVRRRNREAQPDRRWVTNLHSCNCKLRSETTLQRKTDAAICLCVERKTAVSFGLGAIPHLCIGCCR